MAHAIPQDMQSSAHQLSPPEIVLPVAPEDERVWVPLKENVWLRPLMFNTVYMSPDRQNVVANNAYSQLNSVEDHP